MKVAEKDLGVLARRSEIFECLALARERTRVALGRAGWGGGRKRRAIGLAENPAPGEAHRQEGKRRHHENDEVNPGPASNGGYLPGYSARPRAGTQLGWSRLTVACLPQWLLRFLWK